MLNEIFVYDDAFGKAEQVGRQTWFNILTNGNYNIEDLYFTPSKYDKVDGYMSAPHQNNKVWFEIKRRNIQSADYEKEGYILEKIKYDALHKVYSNGDYGWYINIFDDCIKIWDVSLLTPKFEWKNCTATTVENYKKGEKPKLVYLIKETPIITIPMSI